MNVPTLVCLLNDLVTFIYWYLNFQIKGKACGICKNRENETLHVRNICFDWSKDDVRFLACLYIVCCKYDFVLYNR